MKKLLDRRTLVLSSLILLLLLVGFTYNSIMDKNYLVDSTAMTMEEYMLQQEADATIGDTNIEDNTANKDARDATASVTGNVTPEVALTEKELAKEVAANAAKEAFFSDYRIEREKNRGKEKELWENIINSTTTDETFKNMAQEELVKMVSLTEREMIIENLIIAKGFNDALVFLSDGNASVVVNTEELNQQNVAQIQDIIVRKASITPENIKIMQKE